MRKTHLERLEEILGEYYKKLTISYQKIEKYDIFSDKPVDEKIIEDIFSPEICTDIFGYTLEERSLRPQRKMDLAISKQTYHIWKDKKYFDISPLLVQKLKETSIKDINTYFVRSPYRSLYINLPKNNGLYISNKGIQHEVNAIYLLLRNNDEPVSRYILRKNITVDNVTKEISIMFWGEEKGEQGDCIMFSDLLLTDGKISESLDLNVKIIENAALIPELFSLFKFIIKLLLYINCSNASIKNIAGFKLEKKLSDLKNPAKKRKLIKKYSRESLLSHDYIDIQIDHKDRTNGHNNIPTTKNKRKKSLEYVRPHFKIQNYGIQNSKSKIIWIDPYTRGEGAENFRTKKIYRVR
jgi:hypothetical protein